MRFPVHARDMPARFNFAQDVLGRQASESPESIAIVGISPAGIERWTYARVSEASGRVAAAMLRAGLRKGDRVLLFMPRVPLWQVAFAACLHIGAIPVPCVTQITGPELALRARKVGAKGAFTAAGFEDRFSEFSDMLVFRASLGAGSGWISIEGLAQADVPPPPYADMPAREPALLFFTSGSSGPPKAVVHSALGTFVRGIQPWMQLGMTSSDVIWTSTDTGWTRASSCLFFGAWLFGARAVIVEQTLGAAERLALIADQGITFYCAVSTEMRQILAQANTRPVALPKLRWTHSAGEAMTAELAEQWSAFTGAPLLVSFGQTETSSMTLTDPTKPSANGMIGKPFPGARMAVVDASGTELPRGSEGQLAVDAGHPGLMLGYWEEGGLKPAAPVKGWHLTGDLCVMDEQDNFYYVGRADDIISSSGYRISPTEVEGALMRHPALAECAVAASPDAVRGEVVKAFVVLRSGHAGSEQLAKELQAQVQQLIAPYKYPRIVEFVDALPRTANGKLSRRALRDAEFARAKENTP